MTLRKIEFGPKDGLSKKAYKYYSGSTEEIYADRNGIFYIGGEPLYKVGTLADLDAAFCQYQDDIDTEE